MNPNNSKHRVRLKDDWVSARQALKRFRAMRKTLVEDFAGDLWTAPAGDADRYRQQRVVVNSMQQAISAYTMLLAANRPQVDVTTEYRELIAFAKLFSVTLNNLVKCLPVESVLQSAVREACFAMGIVRVGMFPGGTTPYGDPGLPGLEHISFDDWCHDPRAKCWEKRQFCGHEYDADLDMLRGDTNFDQKAVKRLVPGRSGANEGTEENPVKRLETDGNFEDGDEPYDNTVHLIDVWMHREKKLLTFGNGFDQLIRVQDWDGPDHGPYHLLRFEEVPDSIMGLPLAYTLKPLFDLSNTIWRKLNRQARNQKSGTLVNKGAEEDGQAIKNMRDGDMIAVNDVKAAAAYRAPGIDASLAQFLIGVKDELNSLAGNVEYMSGLGPSAGTFGQEKLLGEQVGKRLGKMQNAVVNFARGILADLGHYLWIDEVLVLPGQIPIEEGGIKQSIPVEWMPKDRQGDYFKYNFEIVPYSMAYKTPEEQGSALMGMLTQFIAPMLPYMEQAGVGIDWNAATEALAQLNDLPVLREIIVPQDPPSNAKPGPTDGPRKPPMTQRNYTRTNVPTGGSPRGRRIAQQAAWGGTATPQQQDVVSVPA